ncbi:MAG: ribosomal RNA small subunit methyltransferase A [Planctomycetaceae bacterium]|jgi:16S rRNA (adenine1518-N6/adenine1519-N6)-dimethyltransferase|nr:ribosomal RNA small subunit methyltransferase A [Planctomycetaceae bacterium]MDP7275691.1 16S rRNA (adenine(1518)-N(6)/adenine(1519)-N(6))-dimethyltransferase RsmA [Planctomycetaceae bacterium]
MRTSDRQTRSYLMALFERHGFHPRTAFGQNFLIDLNLIDVLAREASLGPEDLVLEIGTGTGGLTARLAREAGAVITVEVDRNMVGLARELIDELPNVTLLHRDALKNKNHFAPELLELIDERLGEAGDRRLKLIANLPYSIATPIVSNLVASELDWERMVVTIQWELGQRMTAGPGTSDYGALSAWLQSQCRVKMLRRLPPTVFWPRPKVQSAIMKLRPAPERRARIADRAFLQDFLRRGFQQRRKHFRGVLAGMYRKQLGKTDIDEILAELELPAGIRAEQIDVDGLVGLANRLYQRVEQDQGA